MKRQFHTRRHRELVTTAERLAAEIVDCVTRGDDLPEEWERMEALASIGATDASVVVELVRDELVPTGITP